MLIGLPQVNYTESQLYRKELPVFQFSMGRDFLGRPGFVFPSEENKKPSHAILFAIPVPRNIYSIELVRQHIHNYRYYFQLASSSHEMGIAISESFFPDLAFSFKGIDFLFHIELSTIKSFPSFIFPRQFVAYDYVGSLALNLSEDTVFLPLVPKNLKGMDELFFSSGDTFVGKTPMFSSDYDGSNTGGAIIGPVGPITSVVQEISPKSRLQNV